MRTPQSVGAKWPKMLQQDLLQHHQLFLNSWHMAAWIHVFMLFTLHLGPTNQMSQWKSWLVRLYSVFFPPVFSPSIVQLWCSFANWILSFLFFTDMSGTQGHCGPSASTLFSISLTVLCILWKLRVADVTFFMPSFIFLTQTTMDTFLNHLSSFGSLVLTSACRLYLVYMAKWIASLFYDCLRYLLRPALGTVASEYMCHLPANTVSL